MREDRFFRTPSTVAVSRDDHLYMVVGGNEMYATEIPGLLGAISTATITEVTASYYFDIDGTPFDLEDVTTFDDGIGICRNLSTDALSYFINARNVLPFGLDLPYGKVFYAPQTRTVLATGITGATLNIYPRVPVMVS